MVKLRNVGQSRPVLTWIAATRLDRRVDDIPLQCAAPRVVLSGCPSHPSVDTGSIRSPGFAGDESGPKRRPREVERPELGSCSGTYGMGDLRAVQPFLVSPQNEVLALVFLPVPGPDTGHRLRPPKRRPPNPSLNERPCCTVLVVLNNLFFYNMLSMLNDLITSYKCM